MTIYGMLEQSGVLTLLGMAVVFAFLWIMIICVSFTGKLVKAFGLDKEKGNESGQRQEETSGKASQGIVAAITAAVSEFRKKE